MYLSIAGVYIANSNAPEVSGTSSTVGTDFGRDFVYPEGAFLGLNPVERAFPIEDNVNCLQFKGGPPGITRGMDSSLDNGM